MDEITCPLSMAPVTRSNGPLLPRLAKAALFCVLLITSSIGFASSKLHELLGLKPGEWRELPDTRMNTVFPKAERTTWGGVGPSGVVIAWGGAAFDTKRNAFVFTGGGHADYGGNEVYAFFLEELRWRRLTEPSAMKKLDTGQYVTLDNTPVSAHTYDGLEYLPNVDRIFRNGGSEWLTGNNFDRSAWLFDMETRTWERRSEGGGGFPGTAFDPVRGSVYVVGRNYVDEYNPVRSEWIRRNPREPDFLQSVTALDPENRKIITDSFRPDSIIAYSIREDGTISSRNFVNPKGATEWNKMMAALEYDPVRKVLVAWGGGRETAYLDVTTMTWRRFINAKSESAPVRRRDMDYAASGAIYGRWRYVPKYDVFIGYNAPNRNVWVWKPADVADGDDSPASPNPKTQ